MSIDTKVIYGYGYHITDEDIKKLNVETLTKLYESNWFYPVNFWTKSNEGFFGIVLKEMNDNGDLYEVPISIPTDYRDEFKAMIEEYKFFFPGKPHYIARNYICYSIT